MTFRRVSEDVLLWPIGAGKGEFVQQGTLDILDQFALRWLLVCPTGKVASIWYYLAEDQPNITRGDMEFGFIFSVGSYSKFGLKNQRWSEVIIASHKVP